MMLRLKDNDVLCSVMIGGKVLVTRCVLQRDGVQKEIGLVGG